VRLQKKNELELGSFNRASLSQVEKIGAEGDNQRGEDHLDFVSKVEAVGEFLDEVEVCGLQVWTGLTAGRAEEISILHPPSRHGFAAEIGGKVFLAAPETIFPDENS